MRSRRSIDGHNRGRIATVAGAGSPAPVTPVTIFGSQLQEWWRADLGITVATGVSSWLGQVSGTDFAQGTGANQPAYDATGGPNGTAKMTFDGSNDSLAATLARTAPGTLRQNIIWVFQQLSWNVNEPIFNDASATLAVRQIGLTPALSIFGGTIDRANNNALALSTWARGKATFANSTNDALKLAATNQTASATSGNTAGTGPLIGRNAGATLFGHFELAEVMLVTGAITAQMDTDADAYITARYGAGLV